MEYRRLGRAGLKLSELSFGSWLTFVNQLDLNAASNMMAIAYDHGVNFFDNAEAYAHGESETLMGQALHKLKWPRDTYCVSSKVFWGGELPTQLGLSRKHVIEACNHALKRFQLDHLDLYFCHRPDPETPIDETVHAMHTLIMQGKILYWGTSEWSAQEITQAFAVAKENHLTPPSMEQPQYNLFNRQRFEQEYATLFENFGIGSTIWSPLASGLLTGKYNKKIPAHSRATLPSANWLPSKLESQAGQNDLQRVAKLGLIAEQLGISLPQLSLAWCLKNPNVSTVILGASKPEQLLENLQAVEKKHYLSANIMTAIDEIFTP